jgi:hypothetical protein
MSEHLGHFYTEVECYHLNRTQFETGDMPVPDQWRIANAVNEIWKKMELDNFEQETNDQKTLIIKDEL